MHHTSGRLAALLLLAACAGDEPTHTTLTCGAGTEQRGEVCVAVDDSEPEPVDTDVEPLTPGIYRAPVVELQRLQGESNHMHISDVKYRDADGRLFFCSYYFGVINASNPQRMSYLAQGLTHTTPSGSPRDPGCNNLVWSDDDPDLILTTHRKNIDFATFLSSWDLQTSEDGLTVTPVQGPALQEEGVSYEGVDSENGLVYVALHDHGLGIYQIEDDRSFTRIGTLTDLENAYDVIVHGHTAYIADGVGGLVIADVTTPAAPAVLGRYATEGLVRDLIVVDGLAYLAAGSQGLVIVDVSDPADPSFVGSIDTPGTAAGVDVEGERAYIATWNDTRVFDVSDPSNPSFIAGIRNTLNQAYGTDGGMRPDITARTFTVAAKDDFVFVGNWWVPYSYQLHADNRAPYLFLPELDDNIGFGPAALGESRTAVLDVYNHGNEPLTVFDAWADNEVFKVEPRQLAIAPGGSAQLTLTYTATSTDMEWGLLNLWSDDPTQPLRRAYLTGNQPGLGVGVPLPETTANMLDGSTWSSEDHAGKIRLIAYFATFCPVCGTEMPDFTVQFWDAYRDLGVEIIAIDPDDDDTIDGVQAFADNMGLPFPIGLETSTTYDQIQANYDGANPYPTDVIVDRDGIIRYIAVEYDPDSMKRVLDQLLAEE